MDIKHFLFMEVKIKLIDNLQFNNIEKVLEQF